MHYTIRQAKLDLERIELNNQKHVFLELFIHQTYNIHKLLIYINMR